MVYALSVYWGSIWYCIDDCSSCGIPVFHPAACFRLVDGRLSRYWRFTYDEGVEIETQGERLGHEAGIWPVPWAEASGRYDGVVDGSDAAAVEEWFALKRDMDEEFDDATDIIEGA